MTLPVEWDVIVAGAGAGGMAAACVAAAEGCSVLLLEQGEVIGGTTAISGGMVWIPGNHKAAECGRPDTIAAGRDYLAHTVASADPARIEAFLAHGDEAVRYLERHTALRLRPVATYPDYEPDLPGATLGGRVLEPEPYDARALGADFALLRDPLPEFMLWGGMMVSRADIPRIRRVFRSPGAALYVLRLLWRHGLQRLRHRRGTTLYLGNALAARLLQSVRDIGVVVATGWSVQRLLRDGARVTGIEAREANGTVRRFEARRGVILATGGVSHGSLRSGYVPAGAPALSATVDPGAAPRGAMLAAAVGGALARPTPAGGFWVPVSRFVRRDGSVGVFPHTVTDRAKPGLIAVGADGRRFVNEARSYHAFGQAQFAGGPTTATAWLVCDGAFLWRYGLGLVRPFALSVRHEIDSGYLLRGHDLAALGRVIGLPMGSLLETVAAWNQDAAAGVDRAFGRGGDAYQRHMGDAEHPGPNPCIAPIVHGPFFAVAVQPADLGMSAGIRTDAQARVLGHDGRPIEGLYAVGNDMDSVMEGAYPGPGITLGPALTFGYLAARHAASSVAPAHAGEASTRTGKTS